VTSRLSTPPPAAAPPVPHPDAPPPGTRLTSHYARCFGCGEEHPTGLHLEVTVAAGMAITAVFVVTPDHQGAPGLAHGGLLSCAFDEALGSLSWLYRQPAVTARLQTDFRRPVPVGSTLFISARVDAIEGRKVHTSAEGHLGSADGPLAVHASALFVVVDLEHFHTHGRPADVEAAMADPAVRAARRRLEVNP
jgi:acyl-coenzyme A thioesterase PaaI-like protein